jgi:hypothetical protein
LACLSSMRTPASVRLPRVPRSVAGSDSHGLADYRGSAAHRGIDRTTNRHATRAATAERDRRHPGIHTLLGLIG